MVPVDTTMYKESTRKSTIDLVFITPLLRESLITYDIAGDLDNDSDHQLIQSNWTMYTINNSLSL